MTRQPDSRASAGQQLEDEADAITDTVRRDVTTWVARLMRSHPNNPRYRAAIVAGLTAGALDVVWESTGGDWETTRHAFTLNLDAYADAMLEDRAADAQAVAQPLKGGADA